MTAAVDRVMAGALNDWEESFLESRWIIIDGEMPDQLIKERVNQVLGT